MSLLARRLRSQLLSGPPAADPVAVAQRLLAVQAQDLRAARLAVRSRTEDVRASDVDAALSDGSLVVSWLNRGTLHLVRREDYPWLHAVTVPQLVQSNARRLGQEGVTPDAAERGVGVIERALADEGPLTRAQLRERLDTAGVPTDGQALVHLLVRATVQGLIVRGPVLGADHAFVLARDWIGPPAAIDRDVALAELARRYLAGHGPAAEGDLARWARLPLRDVRAALRAIGSELVHVGAGLVALRGTEAARAGGGPELPPPRLLGAFEPVLLGWVSRDEIVGPHRGLVTSNGIFRPFALVRGRAVATWGLAAGRLAIDPLQRISRADRTALDSDGEDVLRYLGFG